MYVLEVGSLPGVLGPFLVLLLCCCSLLLTSCPVSAQVYQVSQCKTATIQIPDGILTGISDFLYFSDPQLIFDLDVSLQISHTWPGDLMVTLEHVDTGTSITLMSRAGGATLPLGCGEDNVLLRFDDDAPLDGPVQDKCPLHGTVSPLESLLAFDGENFGGTWNLTVVDSVVPDTGTMTSWCVIATPPTTTSSTTSTTTTTSSTSTTSMTSTSTTTTSTTSSTSTSTTTVSTTIPSTSSSNSSATFSPPTSTTTRSTRTLSTSIPPPSSVFSSRTSMEDKESQSTSPPTSTRISIIIVLLVLVCILTTIIIGGTCYVLKLKPHSSPSTTSTAELPSWRLSGMYKEDHTSNENEPIPNPRPRSNYSQISRSYGDANNSSGTPSMSSAGIPTHEQAGYAYLSPVFPASQELTNNSNYGGLPTREEVESGNTEFDIVTQI